MKICIPWRDMGAGGPTTFAKKFGRGLEERGVAVTDSLTEDCDLLLIIISASPKILLRAKKYKIPIVQRLDGVYYRAIAGRKWRRANLPIWTTYHLFANHIIFQSKYSQTVCEKFLGQTKRPYSLISNGVDLNIFSPNPVAEQRNSSLEIVSILANYKLAHEVNTVLTGYDLIIKKFPQAKLTIVGKLANSLAHIPSTRPNVQWKTHIPNQELPNLYKNASLMMSAKLRSSCPNAVIEALASGLPVACYDSGGHKELIGEKAGICVPLDDGFGPYPKLDGTELGIAGEKILQNQFAFANEARKRALQNFDLNLMIDRYLHSFEQTLSQ